MAVFISVTRVQERNAIVRDSSNGRSVFLSDAKRVLFHYHNRSSFVHSYRFVRAGGKFFKNEKI